MATVAAPATSSTVNVSEWSVPATATVSVPGPPSSVSPPSSGATNVSSPAPPETMSASVLPPSSVSATSPPVSVSASAPPSTKMCCRPAAASPVPAGVVVGPAEHRDVDQLDLLERLGDVGDVAREQHRRARGGDRHVLVDVRSGEHEPIDAVAADERVAVVARVPRHRVRARVAEHRVTPLPRRDHVGAVAAVDGVGTVGVRDRVVARAGVDRHCASSRGCPNRRTHRCRRRG